MEQGVSTAAFSGPIGPTRRASRRDEPWWDQGENPPTPGILAFAFALFAAAAACSAWPVGSEVIPCPRVCSGMWRLERAGPAVKHGKARREQRHQQKQLRRDHSESEQRPPWQQQKQKQRTGLR